MEYVGMQKLRRIQSHYYCSIRNFTDIWTVPAKYTIKIEREYHSCTANIQGECMGQSQTHHEFA